MNERQKVFYIVAVKVISLMRSVSEMTLIKAKYSFNDGYIVGLYISQALPEKYCIKLARFNFRLYLKATLYKKERKRKIENNFISDLLQTLISERGKVTE